MEKPVGDFSEVAKALLVRRTGRLSARCRFVGDFSEVATRCQFGELADYRRVAGLSATSPKSLRVASSENWPTIGALPVCRRLLRSRYALPVRRTGRLSACCRFVGDFSEVATRCQFGELADYRRVAGLSATSPKSLRVASSENWPTIGALPVCRRLLRSRYALPGAENRPTIKNNTMHQAIAAIGSDQRGQNGAYRNRTRQ